MTDARNVYIIIFVMLLLPIVFYMLRRRFRTKDKNKRLRCLIYMGVMAVIAGFVCIGMYKYTIKHQPLLVAEQAAQTLYQAGISGDDLSSCLQQKGLTDGVITVNVHGEGSWQQFAGATVKIPDKSIQIDGVRFYPVMLAGTNGQSILLAMKVDEGATRTAVEEVQIYWFDQIGTMVDSITFFEPGQIPKQ